MKYFRAPELAFWAAIVAALAVLAVLAATHGNGAAPGGTPNAPIAAPGPEASDARTNVDALTSLMPSGITAGTDPAGLRAFATAVDNQAQAGAQTRQDEGAVSGDEMLAGFNAVSVDARQLAAHAGDPVAATSIRTQLGLAVDHLHSLVLGIPAPELPDTGTNPYPTTPDTPVYPSAPAKPAAPSLGGNQ